MFSRKSKDIHVRLTNEQYYSIYSIYEKYKIACINLTFSDFIRNLLLSLVAKSSDKCDENKTNGE